MDQVQARIAGRNFALSPRDVEEQVGNLLPDPLGHHYVVIAGKRFPPKQVIGLVTGLDRADFNSHQARRILSKLGFVVGRRNREMSVKDSNRPGPHQGRGADLLRPFRGQWVAQRGGFRTVARLSRVQLAVGEVTWGAAVWFCDPWPLAFHLLGQEGFFRWFDVRLRAAMYEIELQRERV